MFATAPVSRASLEDDLHQLWTCLDALLDGARPLRILRTGALSSVTPQAIPSHLAWFDRNLVLRALYRGPDVPADERTTISTLAELERWDAGAGPSIAPEQDALDMRAARDDIRQVLAAAQDESDLDRPVWWPLPLSGGWRTTRFALEACSSHTWNHVLELWSFAHGPGVPATTIASATHRALGRYMQMMVALLDRRRLANTPDLTAVMDFTGPGGGPWTFRIGSGNCLVSEGSPTYADVLIRLSPETYLRTMVLGTESELLAVLAGSIRVEGSMWRAAAFRRLFPRPPRHRVLRPMATNTRLAV